MSTNQSYFNRWETFNVKATSRKHPIKVFLTIIKWLLLFSSVIIFFWGMGTLFFNTNVTVSQVEVLDDKGKLTKIYTDGVFFEVISGYDSDLIYKQHIFNITDNDLYEYSYLSVNNFDDMWRWSSSAFYVLFVLPISWLLTSTTQFLGWDKNNLASDHNLFLMIASIFIVSLLLRLITGVGSWKQQQKQQKMKMLQGKIGDIKNKYKDNTTIEGKQKMQFEIMALYRQEKINPLSASLEGFAFAPLLFAMFVVVRSTRILKDSGTPEFSLTTTMWDAVSAGYWVYLIPIAVYLALMLIDTFLLPRILKVKPKQKVIINPEQNKKTGRWIFKWGFKILFIVFFFLVPTGTSVYWIFSSFFEICQKLLLLFKKFNIKKLLQKNKECRLNDEISKLYM